MRLVCDAAGALCELRAVRNWGLSHERHPYALPSLESGC